MRQRGSSGAYHNRAQALASIVLQKPDEARGRPTTIAEKYYKQLFNESFPEEIYSKCAQVLKRVDAYLDSTGFDRPLRSNLMFHLAMHSVGSALKSPSPRRKTVAALDIAKLTDTLLEASLNVVHAAFKRLGGDDKVAKGKLLAEEITKDLKDRYGRYPGVPEPPEKQSKKK